MFHAEIQSHVSDNPRVLTRYLPKLKIRKEKSLLKGKEIEEEVVEEEPDVILSHWHKVNHC